MSGCNIILSNLTNSLPIALVVRLEFHLLYVRTILHYCYEQFAGSAGLFIYIFMRFLSLHARLARFFLCTTFA